MLYRTIKAFAIRDYNHHQITIIQYNQPLEADAASGSCVCHGHTRAQGYWLALANDHPWRGWSSHLHTHSHIMYRVYRERTSSTRNQVEKNLLFTLEHLFVQKLLVHIEIKISIKKDDALLCSALPNSI